MNDEQLLTLVRETDPHPAARPLPGLLRPRATTRIEVHRRIDTPTLRSGTLDPPREEDDLRVAPNQITPPRPRRVWLSVAASLAFLAGLGALIVWLQASGEDESSLSVAAEEQDQPPESDVEPRVPIPPQEETPAVPDPAETADPAEDPDPAAAPDPAEKRLIVPYSGVDVVLPDPSGSAATGGSPEPDFGDVVAGDDGVGPLSLGTVDVLPGTDYLDFFFEVCAWDRIENCFRDAQFKTPETLPDGTGPF